MDKTCKVMFARFPGNNQEHPESVDWCIKTYHKAKTDPRIGEVLMWKKADTPITMSRNKCLEDAIKLGMDYVVMIDSDMNPDHKCVGAVPFWETCFDWIFDRKSPAIIAAPYCGGESIHHNIFVFQWENFTNPGFPASKVDFKLSQYTRTEAAERGGIQKCAALPTGLMIIDMRILSRMKKPYFYYGFDGDGPECSGCGRPMPGPEAVKSLTEDVAFTRDASLAWFDDPDAGCFCAWDCWAEHIKLCHIPKPVLITPDMVGSRFKEALDGRLPQKEHIREANLSFPKIDKPGDDVLGEGEQWVSTYSIFDKNMNRYTVSEQTFDDFARKEFGDVINS